MWKPTNLMEALLPIFIIDWIFCHGVMHYKSVRKFKIDYSVLYSVITLILYISVLMPLIQINWIEKATKMMDTTDQGLRAMYVIIMICNVSISWSFKNKSVELNLDIIKADRILKNFGASVDIKKEFYFTLKVVALWILFILLTGFTLIIYGIGYHSGSLTIVFNLVFLHGHHASLMVDLKFLLLIKHMRMRFKNLNQLLADFYKINTETFWKIRTITSWATLEGDNSKSIHFLHNIRRMHLELRRLCDRITEIYGTPIALTMVGAFAYFTGLFYHQYLFFVNSNIDIFTLVNAIAFSIWVIPICLKFLSINYICEDTANEWNRTGAILDILELDSEDPKLQLEVSKFLAQIQRNSLKFSPCGLFDLGLYFVSEFTMSVVTYVVIMVQLYPSQ